jgi:DNA (cytosine-5)-methyltransferase 1
MPFAFIDLFAGIGGFHQALQQYGGECVFVSEIDERATQVYERSWLKGNLNVSGNIDNFIKDDKTDVPAHDVLTAGFPCQPFSKSGHQQGINEARGTLFWSIARVLEHRKPKLIILENVRNLVGPKHKNDYLRMIEILREIGYAVSTTPTIISPHQIPEGLGGTPQHRERVFITGVYVGKRKALSYTSIDPLVTAEEIKSWPKVIWNLDKYLETAEKTGIPEYARLSKIEEQAIEVWADFVQTLRGGHTEKLPSFPIWTDFMRSRSQIRISRETPDWKRNFIDKNAQLYMENTNMLDKWRKRSQLELLTPSMRKFEWQAGAAASLDETLLQFRPSGVRVKTRNYVPAFVAINQTSVLVKERRKLLVEETARLQGFNSSLQFKNQEPSASYKQIGNAVHPGVVGFVMDRLIKQAAEFGQSLF